MQMLLQFAFGFVAQASLVRRSVSTKTSGKYFPLQTYLIYLQELAIQIHRHLVCEGSPAPVMINKPLTVLDPERDKSLLQTYTKTQKHSPPLTVTPKIIEFPETEVGKVSGR